MGKKPIHKFNGGLGATLCHHCSVIINTGITDDIYCKDCADNKVTYLNRYRDKIIFEHNGDEVIMIGGSWMRYGIGDDDSITMVDPSGGPYIEIGNNLNKFWPKAEYQDLIVKSITLNNGDNDTTTTVIFKVSGH